MRLLLDPYTILTCFVLIQLFNWFFFNFLIFLLDFIFIVNLVWLWRLNVVRFIHETSFKINGLYDLWVLFIFLQRSLAFLAVIRYDLLLIEGLFLIRLEHGIIFLILLVWEALLIEFIVEIWLILLVETAKSVVCDLLIHPLDIFGLIRTCPKVLSLLRCNLISQSDPFDICVMLDETLSI